MIKYTKHTLKKLEQLLSELEYTIRYERGSFQSGYCLVENRKVAVINKFYDTEGRINCLLDIFVSITGTVSTEGLSPASQKLYQQLLAQTPQSSENDTSQAD